MLSTLSVSTVRKVKELSGSTDVGTLLSMIVILIGPCMLIMFTYLCGM